MRSPEGQSKLLRGAESASVGSATGLAATPSVAVTFGASRSLAWEMAQSGLPESGSATALAADSQAGEDREAATAASAGTETDGGDGGSRVLEGKRAEGSFGASSAGIGIGSAELDASSADPGERHGAGDAKAET